GFAGAERADDPESLVLHGPQVSPPDTQRDPPGPRKDARPPGDAGGREATLSRETTRSAARLAGQSVRVLGRARRGLRFEHLVGLLQAEQLVFERGGVRALGVQLEVAALQAAVGFGQAILEQAFEAGLGVALLRAAAFVL